MRNLILELTIKDKDTGEVLGKVSGDSMDEIDAEIHKVEAIINDHHNHHGK